MNKCVLLCLCCLGLLAVPVIAQETNTAAPAPAEEIAPITPDFWSLPPNEIVLRAESVLQQGDTNACIQMLMVANEMNTRQSAYGYDLLLDLLIKSGDLFQAESLYQNRLAQNDSLVSGYYTRLHQYYAAQSNVNALLEWTAALQTLNLPTALRVQAFAWLLEDSRAAGPVSRVVDLVPVCITSFDAVTARGLLAGIITAYNNSGDQESARKILDAIEKAAQQQPELLRFVIYQRVNMLFAASRWKEAEAGFQKEARTLPDGEAAGCFQFARSCLVRSNQLDVLDSMCAWILKELKQKPSTWQAAANAWLENAKMRKAVREIPVRLDELMKMGVPRNRLLMSYFNYWDVVARENDPASLKAMLKFGDQLAAGSTDQREKEILLVYAFNTYIIMENYEQALKMLDKPFPDMKPDAQQVAINKIKAHLALQKGNKQEAIERFRAFMDHVQSSFEPEIDPVTGLKYTKEMCLGLNARRLGDILKSMDKPREAQAAYREAEGYYAVALKEVQSGSPENRHVQSCLAELAKDAPPAKK